MVTAVYNGKWNTKLKQKNKHSHKTKYYGTIITFNQKRNVTVWSAVEELNGEKWMSFE